MKTERQQKETPLRIMQSKSFLGHINFVDNRTSFLLQRKGINTIQRGGGLSPWIIFLLPLLANSPEKMDIIAKKLGISRNLLEYRLRNGLPKVAEGQWTEYEKGNEVEYEKILLMSDASFRLELVPAFILEGLRFKSTENKLRMLFERINNLNFTYSGNSNLLGSGFYTHKGDCKTLAVMFIDATIAAGINGVKLEYEGNKMLVDSASIHGRNENHNTLGKHYWHFEEHYWCTYGAHIYDLLFMKESAVQMHMFKQEESIEITPPVKYYGTKVKKIRVKVDLYSNGCYVFLDKDINKMRVFGKKKSFINYILKTRLGYPGKCRLRV